MVEKEKEPYDLHLTVSYIFLLEALVKVGVVIGFFDIFLLSCFQFGFLIVKQILALKNFS